MNYKYAGTPESIRVAVREVASRDGVEGIFLWEEKEEGRKEREEKERGKRREREEEGRKKVIERK